MKTIWMLVILSIFTITNISPCLAQVRQTKQEKQTQKIKQKIQKIGVGEKTKIKVELYNSTIYQGSLKEINEENFVLTDKLGNSNSIKYADIKKVGGINLSTGAKIGIGAGIGAGATILFILIYLYTNDS